VADIYIDTQIKGYKDKVQQIADIQLFLEGYLEKFAKLPASAQELWIAKDPLLSACVKFADFIDKFQIKVDKNKLGTGTGGK
jgi:hypothetical protein